MTTTNIEWANQVWNPLVGCTVHSPGCTNCYAMKMAHRLESMARMGKNSGVLHYLGTTKAVNGNPVWTGRVNLAPETTLLAPLRRKKPTRYFVNSMSDLFHQDVPDEWIDRIFAVMALCPQHTFQVLTKRSDRMRDYLTTPARHGAVLIAAKALGATQAPTAWPLPNVWLGVSVEDQQRWDVRTDDLRKTPAVVHWISAEPLLGPVRDDFGMEGLDWIVVGGESGKSARPMHPDWARSLRDQCAAAGVPFFFKQWGEWAEVDEGPYNFLMGPDGERCTGSETVNGAEPMRKVGKKAAGRLLDGIEHNAMPGGSS